MTLKQPPTATGPAADRGLLAPTGDAPMDSLRAVVGDVVAPFENAPDPAKGELGALVPDADAPVAYRRPHTEFLSGPIAQAPPADDSSAIRVRIFARKPLDDEPTTQVPPKLLP